VNKILIGMVSVLALLSAAAYGQMMGGYNVYGYDFMAMMMYMSVFGAIFFVIGSFVFSAIFWWTYNRMVADKGRK
jgi:uncharacterized membrane protein